ncbi:MAG: phosphopentomutase [Hyphomicrobiales bacterium]|nr:phosphopentomutase [Hyphomicrobiales bacterium]
MARAVIIVLDSLGCGGASDAGDFGDSGADTLGHIAQACAAGACDTPFRSGPLRAPTLDSLGLGLAAETSAGALPPGFSRTPRAGASYGCAAEVSRGKDTPSGHWELAGAPLLTPFGVFAHNTPALPADLVAAIVREGALPGVLGDTHATGIAIIEDFGEEHLRTGKPILYTSVDSVLQIAAHEEAFGLARLYELCGVVRRLVDPLRIGRVIARPFVGRDRASFKRTPHRKDFAMPAPAGNVLDRAAQAGRAIVSVGKIGDIFDHRNTGEEIKGSDDMDLFDKMSKAFARLPDGGLAFANFVDLDTDYGHRRDVAGYAAGLERLDARLGAFLPLLRPGDLCVVTADHGNDPSWRGTDHTRENVPVLAYEPGAKGANLGARATFADIGASVARRLGLEPTASGASWL